jgi:hypothetical protein
LRLVQHTFQHLQCNAQHADARKKHHTMMPHILSTRVRPCGHARQHRPDTNATRRHGRIGDPHESFICMPIPLVAPINHSRWHR